MYFIESIQKAKEIMLSQLQEELAEFEASLGLAPGRSPMTSAINQKIEGTRMMISMLKAHTFREEPK